MRLSAASVASAAVVMFLAGALGAVCVLALARPAPEVRRLDVVHHVRFTLEAKYPEVVKGELPDALRDVDPKRLAQLESIEAREVSR